MLEPPLPVKPPVHRPAGVRSAAEVKRELDRQRPSAARRGYGPRWRRARAAFLARHPLCAACRALGRVVPATIVDHVVPHRGSGRAQRAEATVPAGAGHAPPSWRSTRSAPPARPRGAWCATVVDHVVPHRGDQRLFWDERNWAPACKPCHDAKTAREGRWG